MWDPPRPGIESMSPALEDGFFTTEPSGKPSNSFLKNKIFNLSAVAKFKGQCRHFYFLDLILSEAEGNKLPLLPAFLEEWRPCFNHSGSGTQIRKKKKLSKIDERDSKNKESFFASQDRCVPVLSLQPRGCTLSNSFLHCGHQHVFYRAQRISDSNELHRKWSRW